MNILRGMFRFWIILTVLYAIVVVGVAIGNYQYILPEKVYVLTSPGADLATLVKPWERNSDAITRSHNRLHFKDRVVLLVHNSVPIDTVEAKRDAYEASWSDERHSARMAELPAYLGRTLAALVIPPLIVLALGAAIAWALSGFRRGA